RTAVVCDEKKTAPFVTPVHGSWQSVMPDGVTLTTPPVTLTSAWWIPPWYHRHSDCIANMPA
ncbi:MAG TPA: hypothetical protein VGS80_25625, partial [Ktedonobacterales bacterium]|nr:hypothetical protein [Ktedonobacterales bacterium]